MDDNVIFPAQVRKGLHHLPRAVRPKFNCGGVSARQRLRAFSGNTAGAILMTRKRKAVSQKNRMYLLDYYVWWVSLPLGDIPLCCVC